MIQLHEDCLLVEQPEGGFIPWSASQLTLEFVGSAAEAISEEVMKQVAAGVLHYFKHELGRMTITVAEFANAIAVALNGMGYTAEVSEISHPSDDTGAAESAVKVADLRELAVAAGKFGELDFFKRLHTKLREQMENSPSRVEFLGLRGCVKMLTGRKKWCHVCTQLESEIVESLRGWYGQEPAAATTALLVH